MQLTLLHDVYREMQPIISQYDFDASNDDGFFLALPSNFSYYPNPRIIGFHYHDRWTAIRSRLSLLQEQQLGSKILDWSNFVDLELDIFHANKHRYLVFWIKFCFSSAVLRVMRSEMIISFESFYRYYNETRIRKLWDKNVTISCYIMFR